jgi:hypothetical protein
LLAGTPLPSERHVPTAAEELLARSRDHFGGRRSGSRLGRRLLDPTGADLFLLAELRLEPPGRLVVAVLFGPVPFRVGTTQMVVFPARRGAFSATQNKADWIARLNRSGRSSGRRLTKSQSMWVFRRQVITRGKAA